MEEYNYSDLCGFEEAAWRECMKGERDPSVSAMPVVPTMLDM